MTTPNMCWFVYKGANYEDDQLGWINSPFYADSYPTNITCLYLFYLEVDQSIRLSFVDFKIAEDGVDPPMVANDPFHQQYGNCKGVS